MGSAVASGGHLRLVLPGTAGRLPAQFDTEGSERPTERPLMEQRAQKLLN